MSGPKTRARLVSRVALLGAALALATVGCSEDADDDSQLARRQAQLDDAALDLYSFVSPPETPSDECTVTLVAGSGVAGDAAMIQAAVDAASAFEVICLAPGTYTMSFAVVVADPASLTIRGLGADPTDVELDFSGQADSNGFTVTSPGFWLENLWVHDASGLGVSLLANSAEEDPSVVRKVKVSWGADDSEVTNGWGGVLVGDSEFVIVEFSELIGAVVAGVVIDTSSDVIVRYSYPHANNIGISFTNSTDTELVSNGVTDNTTGILALQSPTAELTRNENVLVVENQIWANNRPSFSNPFFGVASAAPVGTGLMVVAGTNIELRENWVYDNTSTGLLVLANYTADALASLATTPDWPDYDAFPGYDPFPTNIYVNRNIFEFLPDNEDFQDEAYNGIPVDQDFIDDWDDMDAIAGSPNYNPIPPCMSDDPNTTSTSAAQPPPGCRTVESDDPNTQFIAELINRPIMLDGTSLDFLGVVPEDPAMCIQDEDESPLVYISLDTPRRGYPLGDGTAPRQDEFDCELPELPEISFP